MENPINVTYKQAWAVHVFTFEWETDEMNTDETFAYVYDTLGDFAGKKVLFNFAKLRYLNSKSIGCIADIYNNLNENNGTLYICNIDQVRDTLELMGIPSIIEVYDTQAEALESAK